MNLRNSILDELNTKILPFWTSLKDDEFGGYYGEVNADLKVDKKANKCSLTLSRYLYAFSRVANDINESYRTYADHAYEFLMKHFYDREFYGVYFLSDYQGNIINDKKHTYVQGFFIYALSEYYKLTQKEEALATALKTFQVIESKMLDKVFNGYLEEFTRDFTLTDNELTSEHGITAYFTTNTHLHLLEAYTNLYEVSKAPKVRNRILFLLELFNSKIKVGSSYQVFFDRDFDNILDTISYGHDIETTWLIDKAVEVIGLERTTYFKRHLSKVVDECLKYMNDDGSMTLEVVRGIKHPNRVWWVQAEALVGFYNAFELTGNKKYLKTVHELWKYIDTYLSDKRENSEWFWQLDEHNKPTNDNIVELWKTPYHNVRFCVEMIIRLKTAE